MSTGTSEQPLVVTHVVSGDIWAGAEAQVCQLVRALKANQTVVPTAVVFNDGALMRKLKATGIAVTLADESVESPLGIIRGLCRHFRHHQTNIVHTHGFKENVLGTIAQKLCGVPRSVRTAHGNPESAKSWRSPGRKLTGLMDRLTAQYGQDAVIAVSSQLERDLSHVYPGKIIRILNFIEIPEVPAEPATRKATDGVIEIGLVGRLVPVKRPDLFIDTIGLLSEQLAVTVKGIVIGDGPLLERLKKYADEKGLSELIEFRGFVADPAKELEQLDLLIMPSDHEGIPMVLLESILAGLPIVAHNVGGIPEILDQGRCGLLVDDHTARGYADKAALLLKDTELMTQLTASARVHLFKEFNKDKNTLKYEALYQSFFNPRDAVCTFYR